MLSIKELKGVVEQELQQLPIVSKPENLYRPIEYIMTLGGKRIRPVMCLAACHLFSGDYSKAIPAAIGIELFHNFTLLHDDIMDNAPMRRNHDTVHVKWNANTAILSGDAMMIKALQAVAKIDSPRFKEVLDVFNTTALEVCEGQQYDMEFERRDEVSEAEYLEMIRLKTAVLLAGSMKIGALVGVLPILMPTTFMLLHKILAWHFSFRTICWMFMAMKHNLERVLAAILWPIKRPICSSKLANWPTINNCLF